MQLANDLASSGRAPAASVTVPPPLAADLEAFTRCLHTQGLRAALQYMNRRTPHRFTGIFRFDGDMLRSVALVDKWHANVTRGEDVPLAGAYCAHLHGTGQAIAVEDGSRDPRVPWMSLSEILSYSGAAILDESGQRWGALCHFDQARCESKGSDMPLLIAAAAIVYDAAAAQAQAN